MTQPSWQGHQWPLLPKFLIERHYLDMWDQLAKALELWDFDYMRRTAKHLVLRILVLEQRPLCAKIGSIWYSDKERYSICFTNHALMSSQTQIALGSMLPGKLKLQWNARLSEPESWLWSHQVDCLWLYPEHHWCTQHRSLKTYGARPLCKFHLCWSLLVCCSHRYGGAFKDIVCSNER